MIQYSNSSYTVKKTVMLLSVNIVRLAQITFGAGAVTQINQQSIPQTQVKPTR